MELTKQLELLKQLCEIDGVSGGEEKVADWLKNHLPEDCKVRTDALGNLICEKKGKQTPSRNRINALLQRLGLPDDRYFALLSKNELEMEALQKEIVACNATEKVPEGFEKLAQFEKLADPDDQIAQQFALRSRVLLGRLDGRYTPLEQIDLLMQAIRLTVPRFDLESIESFLYTRDEITIINQIGLAYSDAGQNKKAAEIYYQLLKYVRKHFKETITSIGVLPLVLYNYARVLDLCGRYEEGTALAKEGREACIQYGHYQELPRCLEIEAECRHFMGDDEISKELYYQSYYLCKVIGYQIGLEVVKKEAKEYLNIDFMS